MTSPVIAAAAPAVDPRLEDALAAVELRLSDLGEALRAQIGRAHV